MNTDTKDYDTDYEPAQQQVPHERVVICPHCDDGDGHCIFPYYGVAPHVHGTNWTTGVLPPDMWPDNFSEDPEAPGCGTYTHCPECGAGR